VAKKSKSGKKKTVAKKKKTTATKAKKTAKKVTKAKAKSTKKTAKKVAKKTAKKATKKVTKKAGSAAKKTAKKVSKKVANKPSKKTVTKAKAAPAKAKAKAAPAKAKAKAAPAKAKAKAAPAKAKAKTVTKAKKPAAPKKAAPTTAAAVTPSEAAHLPQVGDHAPEFTLSTDQGTTVSLHDYLGKKNVVLYFYPKDDTPGCTKEACTFQEHLDHFTATDTIIVGVSPDDTASHGKFRQKYSLSFPLGADVDSSVATRYGVWGEKSMYGRTYMGVSRATFLINKHGKIAAVWPKVKVDGHSEEVQAAIAAL